PGPEGGDELALVDQADLQGEQAEEQVAVGGDGGHGAGLPKGRHGRWASDGGASAQGSGSVVLSHDGSAHAVPPRPIRPPAHSTAPWLRPRAGAPFIRRRRTAEGTDT